MLRLIAPPEKVGPWLDKQLAYGRRLLELPVGTEDEITDAFSAVHSWYLHLFEGFQRAVHTDEPYDLNLNMIIANTAWTGGASPESQAKYRTRVEQYLALIQRVRALC